MTLLLLIHKMPRPSSNRFRIILIVLMLLVLVGNYIRKNADLLPPPFGKIIHTVESIFIAVEAPEKEITIEDIRDEKLFIDELTEEKRIIAYLKTYNELPNYYITKKEAQQKGWLPSQGNLCKVLPFMAIGGDRFMNREGKLPTQKGRLYFEADINYNCGQRNADRLVYSNDGLIFITHDHYQTFTNAN